MYVCIYIFKSKEEFNCGSNRTHFRFMAQLSKYDCDRKTKENTGVDERNNRGKCEEKEIEINRERRKDIYI